jgi:hypothetical protein
MQAIADPPCQHVPIKCVWIADQDTDLVGRVCHEMPWMTALQREPGFRDVDMRYMYAHATIIRLHRCLLSYYSMTEINVTNAFEQIRSFKRLARIGC